MLASSGQTLDHFSLDEQLAFATLMGLLTAKRTSGAIDLMEKVDTALGACRRSAGAA